MTRERGGAARMLFSLISRPYGIFILSLPQSITRSLEILKLSSLCYKLPLISPYTRFWSSVCAGND